MKKHAQPRYIDRLKAHPGVGMAFLITLMGGLAGMANESMSAMHGFVFGLIVMGAVCWPIVLWTARTQPVDE